MRNQLLILLFNIITISSFSQAADINKEAINLQPSPSTELSFKYQISNWITMRSLQGHVWLIDSLNITDSLHSITTNERIRLNSGTTWNPTEEPPQARFILFKVIFNKLDSADNDRLNYLELITTYDNNKIKGLNMIDYLYFNSSYYDSKNIKRYSVDYYLKPNDDGKLILTEKTITYCKKSND